MSQNDFNLANQGFPQFRADLNSALQALASTSSGATAPGTTYAYQLWYDTSTNLLKMRNADNDGWITLALFDQTADEWEIRSAVIQAVDGAGVTIKTDDGVARITVADNGDVGIGTSSPTRNLHVRQDSASSAVSIFAENNSATSGANAQLELDASGNNFSITNYPDADVSNANRTDFGSTAGGSYFTFSPNNAERMRIDASGNLLVGTTSATAPLGGIAIRPNTIAGAVYCLIDRTSTTSTSFPFEFKNGGSGVGSISFTNTATAFNTSSDYRLKEDVQPMVGASYRLMALKPVNFAWKVDGSRVDGFLAHEVQAVVPECVTGTKDQVETVEIKDEDGNVIGTEQRPVYQGIDQGKLVPLLTAALQEALTKIEDLEARIVALETQ